MLRGAGQERQGFGHPGPRPNHAARRPKRRLRVRVRALQLPNGDMAAAVGLLVAGSFVALFVLWHLAGFAPIWGEEPRAPAAYRPALIIPSGCTVLELDRSTNRTIPKACPSHI